MDKRNLPPKCGSCGYYFTDDAQYSGYRCVDESHRHNAGYTDEEIKAMDTERKMAQPFTVRA